MNKRILTALVALVGMFVAMYLTLYKLGYIGTLACSVGSCETVQTSRWATLFGVPVGAWGIGFYLAVLGLSLVGVMPAHAEKRSISRLLFAMTAFGVVFSIWLTYLELFVINAICQWCVISAVLTAVLCTLSWMDLREVALLSDDAVLDAGEALRGTGYGRNLRNTMETSMRAVDEPPSRED